MKALDYYYICGTHFSDSLSDAYTIALLDRKWMNTPTRMYWRKNTTNHLDSPLEPSLAVRSLYQPNV